LPAELRHHHREVGGGGGLALSRLRRGEGDHAKLLRRREQQRGAQRTVGLRDRVPRLGLRQELDLLETVGLLVLVGGPPRRTLAPPPPPRETAVTVATPAR